MRQLMVAGEARSQRHRKIRIRRPAHRRSSSSVPRPASGSDARSARTKCEEPIEENTQKTKKRHRLPDGELLRFLRFHVPWLRAWSLARLLVPP